MSRWGSRPHANHIAAAAGLREMPGVWLRVGLYRARYSAQNTAADVRAGRGQLEDNYIEAARQSAFEARVEPVGDETGLYVRYTPTTTPATEMEAADAR